VHEAIVYAVDNGAKVISMSFAGPDGFILEDSILYATQHGVIMVAGAGNTDDESILFPAAYSAYPDFADSVIAVAGSSYLDTKTWGEGSSTYGSWIDIAAPGGIIRTTSFWQGQYAESGGTSLATPFVSGVAGLLYGLNPSLTTAQIKQKIEAGADPMPNEPLFAQGKLGAGRLNAYNSVCTLTDCRPDIQLWGVYTSSGYINQPLEVNFTIKSDHPMAWNVSYHLDSNSSDPDIDGSVIVPAFGQVKITRYMTFAEPGFHNEAYVKVDSTHNISETIESNNQGQMPFWVYDNRPDVKVVSVSAQSTPKPRSGKTFDFQFTLQNNGSSALDVHYRVVLGSADPAVYGSASVPANGQTPVTVKLNYSADGTYSINVTADWNNNINESNELNNWLALPGVLVQNLAPVISVPLNGSSTTVLAGVNLNFTARASDVNNDSISYSWYLWNGTSWVQKGSSATQSFRFSPGTYQLKARATDGSLWSESFLRIKAEAPVPSRPPRDIHVEQI
jgi:hypothetical protein